MKLTLALKKQQQRDAEIAKAIQKGIESTKNSRSYLDRLIENQRIANAQMREF